MRLSRLVGTVQVLVTGLVAGIFVAILVTGPARLALEPAALVQLQQGMHLIFQQMMPPFAMTAILAGVVWMISLRKQFRSARFFFAALSTLSALAAAIVTFTLNFPLNDLLMTWNPGAPPTNVRELWLPWERDHMIRTVLYVVSFVSAVTANGLFRNGTPDMRVPVDLPPD